MNKKIECLEAKSDGEGGWILVQDPSQTIYYRGWISVEEALPDVGEEVLCCFGIGEWMSIDVLIMLEDNKFYDTAYVHSSSTSSSGLRSSRAEYEVTHWMRLPEFPK